VDWAFAYFPHSFAGSPATEVVLDWGADGLTLSPSLTGKPAPETDELFRRAEAVREVAEWQEEDPQMWPYRDVFPEAIALMYSGHESIGWRYLRESWGGPEEERLRFEQKVREPLNTSMYYAQLVSARRGSD
jgi:hypothetical protein